MNDETTAPSPDALTTAAAYMAADVEHYVNLSPLQRYVADLARRVEALEAREAARNLEN